MPFQRSIPIYVGVLVIVAVMLPGTCFAKMKRDRVANDFKKADINRDNRLSQKEWSLRGNFERLDKNSDGFLSLREVREMYKGHGKRRYSWPPEGTTKKRIKIDETVFKDRVDMDSLDKETKCGIARLKRCDTEDQIRRGLLATGTGPLFPENMNCPGIDDYWAMDYTSKRNRVSYHGGIDIPAPWGAPMRAVASGSVVAMYKAHLSKRGNEVVLRHRPEQTGLPMWIYTAYGHLDALPDFKIGQQLKMGDIIGPTGNSGISARGKKGSGQSRTRRPAIHLAMFYSAVPQYSQVKDTIVPLDGYWLDPMAFYRQKGPFESGKVKALPDNDKSVPIPVLSEDGTTIPVNTKVIWPYSCKRDYSVSQKYVPKKVKKSLDFCI